MPLSERQKKQLRSLGHPLKPVVIVAGKGLSDTVVAALEEALTYHELIKVSIRVGSHEARASTIANIESLTGAETVQRIGNIALMFRRNLKAPRVALGPA